MNESGQGALEQHDAEPTVVDNISEVTTPYLGETRVSVIAAQPHIRFDTIEPQVLRALLRGPSMGPDEYAFTQRGARKFSIDNQSVHVAGRLVRIGPDHRV